MKKSPEILTFDLKIKNKNKNESTHFLSHFSYVFCHKKQYFPNVDDFYEMLKTSSLTNVKYSYFQN